MKNIYITDLSLSDYTKKTWNSYVNEAILTIATTRTYSNSVDAVAKYLESLRV